MQPSQDPQQVAGWPPPGTGSYARPSYAPGGPAGFTTRSRPWLIGLSAMGTILVLFLALDNSAVTNKIFEHATNSNSFGSRALQSLTAFGWNLGRLGSEDQGRLYLASLLTDLAVLVVVLLFVAAVTRGRGSFGHVFAATWIAVIAAFMIASYVRPMVLDLSKLAPQYNGRPTNIFFSVYSPSAIVLFVAIVYGLFAALVAGLVGVLSRRRDMVTAPGVPAAPAPWSESGSGSGSEPTSATREPWSAPPAAAAPGPIADPSPWGKESPEDSDDADRTTQLPAVDSPQPAPSEGGEQHTIQLPRADDST